MKNLLTTTVLAVIMTSPAFAGERTVTVPTPKSITLVCSEKNQKIIKKLSFIDKVIIFNSYDNFF